MISVRVRMTFQWGVFWSSAIHNPKALAWLKVALREQRVGFEVFDDVEHAYVADGCFEIAKHNGRGSAEFRWGPGGNPVYRCDLAELPKATGLLDDQVNAACGGKEDLPRELVGPTHEEVAQHTPTAVMAFDHGGGRARKPQPTTSVTEPSAAEYWFDRLLAWVTGSPRGNEVQK